MTQIACIVCGCGRAMPPAKDGRPRTPRGWKVLKGEPHCPVCKRTSYSLRAIIVPVVSPLTGSWASLRQELRVLWSETTRCANWLISELYTRDTRRSADDRKLGAMPSLYLYPAARAQFPRLPPQAVAALTQDVLRLYRAKRYDVLWTRSASLPSYRYPVPLTLPKQAWSLEEDHGTWCVSVRLSSARWRLRLRGGAPMRRQAERLRELFEGTAERASLTLYQSKAAGSDVPRLMVKIAAWLPKTAPRASGAVFAAGPNADSLLAVEPRWRVDPAPIRGVLAADARRRSSLLDNLHSLGGARGRQDGIHRALADLSRRTQHRLVDSCRTYAAALAAHAVSSGAREVRYDDRARPALTHYPWELLRRRVAETLDERGIKFVYVPDERAPQATNSAQDGENAA